MKKFLSLLLTGVMSAMLLAGCGTTSKAFHGLQRLKGRQLE